MNCKPNFSTAYTKPISKSAIFVYYISIYTCTNHIMNQTLTKNEPKSHIAFILLHQGIFPKNGRRDKVMFQAIDVYPGADNSTDCDHSA